ncbi:hypothetical protein R3P38DRAFT_723573 [Favolaschia claudopus]|uniref:FAD/NAD(P)-binding domain-containing protein n=1 Tax=Favolaschia claudopus TaxID=2862362 RepID=A0AAV9Z4C7_9AGAR
MLLARHLNQRAEGCRLSFVRVKLKKSGASSIRISAATDASSSGLTMISFATLNGLSMLANLILLAAAQSQQAFQFTTDHASVNAEWTTFTRKIQGVAVIGAGPSGLQAATHLLAANLAVRLFERAPAPGGQWFHTEETPVREQYPETDARDTEIPPENVPATKYYEEGDGGVSLDERWREHWHPRPVWYDLIANSPADKTRLPGVQYAPDAPWEVSVHDVQRNVRAYASLHGLNSNDNPISSHSPPITSYATRVESIHKCNETDTWTLKLRRLEWLPESKRLNAEWWTEEFDAVVVASGAFTEAKVPQIKDIGNWSKAKKDGKYSIYHAQSYRHPEPYTGKTVLIVGASVTATYLARSIAPFAGRLICSVRPNQYRDALGWDILFRFPEKADMIPEIESFEPLGEFTTGIKGAESTWSMDQQLLGSMRLFLPQDIIPKPFSQILYTGRGTTHSAKLKLSVIPVQCFLEHFLVRRNHYFRHRFLSCRNFCFLFHLLKRQYSSFTGKLSIINVNNVYCKVYWYHRKFQFCGVTWTTRLCSNHRKFD